jgi:prophage regulatory protein
MRGARMATATLKIEDLDFRLLRLNEVLKLIPVSRASFYEGIEKGHYPKPLKVGKKLSVWKLSDIRALVAKIERENGITVQ